MEISPVKLRYQRFSEPTRFWLVNTAGYLYTFVLDVNTCFCVSDIIHFEDVIYDNYWEARKAALNMGLKPVFEQTRLFVIEG